MGVILDKFTKVTTSENRNLFSNTEVLFRDSGHENVYNGDTVQWYEEGHIFPYSGEVGTYKGLHVAHFNSITQKWSRTDIALQPKRDTE